MHIQGPVPIPEVEGLEHSGETEPVIGVQVRDEDLIQIREPDRAQQLALRALAAVHEDAIAAPAHEQRGQTAALGGQRAAGACEEDREFH